MNLFAFMAIAAAVAGVIIVLATLAVRLSSSRSRQPQGSPTFGADRKWASRDKTDTLGNSATPAAPKPGPKPSLDGPDSSSTADPSDPVSTPTTDGLDPVEWTVSDDGWIPPVAASDDKDSNDGWITSDLTPSPADVASRPPPGVSDRPKSFDGGRIFRLLADIDSGRRPTEILLTVRIAATGVDEAQFEGNSFSASPNTAFELFMDYEGFKPIDTTTAVLTVENGRRSNLVACRFEIVPSHRRWIALTVVQANRHLDTLLIEDIEITKEYSLPLIGHNSEFDFFIKVDKQGRVSALSTSVVDDILLREYGEIDIVSEGRGNLDQKVAALWSKEWVSQQEAADEVERLGREVSLAMPAELLGYLKSADGPLDVLVEHHADFDFPFELAYLRHEAERPVYLGEKHRVVRTLPTATKPAVNLLAKSIASIRDEDLMVGHEEAFQSHHEVLDSLCVDVGKIATISDLRNRVFRRRQFDVLDFVGHVAVDDQNRSGLQLTEGYLKAHDQLVESERVFATKRPLVFMNGCSATRSSFGVFCNSSFPEVFLELGACSFVGTTLPILAEDALQFANHFYALLGRGIEVSESVRQARIYLANDYLPRSGHLGPEVELRRLSALAYAVFGNPRTVVSFDDRAKLSVEGTSTDVEY